MKRDLRSRHADLMTICTAFPALVLASLMLFGQPATEWLLVLAMVVSAANLVWTTRVLFGDVPPQPGNEERDADSVERQAEK